MKYQHLTLEVESISANDATITTLVVYDDLHEIWSTSTTAKKHPNDKYNCNIGFYYSQARALARFAKFLMNNATGQVRHMERQEKNQAKKRLRDAELARANDQHAKEKAMRKLAKSTCFIKVSNPKDFDNEPEVLREP